MATVDIIKDAAKSGCNLLVVHELTFYSTPDFRGWSAKHSNEKYEMKQELIDDLGVTIRRDHYHMFAYRPNCIFTGVEKYLRWNKYNVELKGVSPLMYAFDIPETSVVGLQ